MINRLFDHLQDQLKKVGSDISAYDWAEKLGMTRQRLHGGQYNGPQCAKLLKNLDILREILGIEMNKDCIKCIVLAFEAADEVKTACFGQVVMPNYQDKIKSFRIAYMKLGITVTPKVHALLVHVHQFLESKKGQGLGVWSDQASESVHQNFSALWVNSCYKRDLVHSKYASQLLNCVVTYNSRHI